MIGGVYIRRRTCYYDNVRSHFALAAHRRITVDNVNVKVEGNRMTIEVDLTKRGEVSVSKKSIFVANTNGFAKVEGHDGMKFSLNVIVPNPDAPR